MRSSKRKLISEVLDKSCELFFNVIGKNNSQSDFYKILDFILSKNEKSAIVKRVSIYYLHIKGFNQEHIADILCVAQSTVEKYVFKFGIQQNHLHSKLQDILFKEKVFSFFDDLFDDIYYHPGKYGVNWHDAWLKKYYKLRVKERGI